MGEDVSEAGTPVMVSEELNMGCIVGIDYKYNKLNLNTCLLSSY